MVLLLTSRSSWTVWTMVVKTIFEYLRMRAFGGENDPPAWAIRCEHLRVGQRTGEAVSCHAHHILILSNFCNEEKRIFSVRFHAKNHSTFILSIGHGIGRTFVSFSHTTSNFRSSQSFRFPPLNFWCDTKLFRDFFYVCFGHFTHLRNGVNGAHRSWGLR